MRAAYVSIVVVAVTGCDWSLHRMQDQPRCEWYEGGDCAEQAPPVGAVELHAPLAEAPRPPRTRAELMRGEDRFDRFCAPCHGLAGDGDSAVARAMSLRKPPSLVDATVAKFADVRIESVIANGYGLMPSYAGALAPIDRWAIVDYVRALQGRVVATDALTPDDKQEAPSWLR